MSAIEDGTAAKLLQPERLGIIQQMLKAGAPVYIDQIAKVLKIDPLLVSFHMDKMEDSGLVASALKIVQKEGSRRGWAGRFFEPTPKLRDAFAQVATLAAEVKEGLDGI